MNKKYSNWKNEYETAINNHLKENYRIIYPYQDEYQKYTQSEEWINVGTSNDFFRAGTENITPMITRTFGKIMHNDLDIFKGLATDELNRINPLSDDDDELNNALNYSNFNIAYDTLSDAEKEVYEECKKAYIKANRKTIELFKN